MVPEPFGGYCFGVVILDAVFAVPVVVGGFFSTFGVFNAGVFVGSTFVSGGFVAVVGGLALGSGFLIVLAGFIDYKKNN